MTAMNRILVITYPRKEDRIASVMEAEYAMTNSWRDQGIIEHLFAKTNDGGGIVVFNETSMEKVQSLMAQLPLFPFFDRVEYFPITKIY
ncbi:MAG: muconolactone Delta-isomerase family protein [Candidatus Desulfobacillus denitrificans]